MTTHHDGSDYLSRSTSFIVSGPVNTRVEITEQNDGTLRLDLTVLGSGLLGDLRGFFFDLNDLDASQAQLAVTGIDGSEELLTSSRIAEGKVDSVRGDVNMKGSAVKQTGKFDVGVAFGTPGMGKDDVSSASFILSSDSMALSLDSLDLADLGLRYTSVGDTDHRSGSEKIVGMTSGVARNDAFEVDENSSNTLDLLVNDSNGILADGTRKTVIAVEDADGLLALEDDGFQRLVVIDGLELGTLTVSEDGVASFEADGADIDRLGHDAIRTYRFAYQTQSQEGNLASAAVEITIDGQNDQPIAQNLAFSVDEDDAFDPRDPSLIGDGVTGSFLASDIDIGDTLSYAIISAPTDAFGNQYGEVVNNGNGTFTFNPRDNFQFLDEGESRDVTFDYVAIDDSGVGTSPTAPEESDTSAPKTVTITVNGSDDAPLQVTDQLLFQTENQSMFGTGEALILQPDLPFLGFDTGNLSLDATIIPSYTFSGDVLDGIFEGIEVIAQAFADLGCEIGSWFGADCEADIDLPDSITTPRVGTSGYLDARVGLQPYFYFNSGEVDSEIPVDIRFQFPRQVEASDTFQIDSIYSLDGGANFTTMSPNVNFGMDFVFDLDTRLDVLLGSSTLNLFNFDTGGITGFEGSLGEPGFNIFDFNAEDDLETSIDLGRLATLDLNFPVIETTGELDPPGSNTLTSEGEDDVAVLDIDVDAVVSQIIQSATGVPIQFGDSGSEGLTIDVAGASLNLISLEYDWDLFTVNLITTLKAIQEFELEVMDLPLMAMLEDGSTINGFSLGDSITVGELSGFDADVDGNADGLIDFMVDVDMEAVFSNLSTLGLDMDLFTGLLRFDAGITSDFADNLPTFSLFDPNGDDGGFLLSETTSLVSDVPLATLFEDDFDLVGWNNPQSTQLLYDVA
ncbi:VCBS domain-containing protein [Halomonas sp. LS-001]